ncbi:MAG: thioredoxin family protein [Phycisphaerales bacterium]|nr:thioredoxin family protein [Phycisphaerales bacterium]
MKSSLLSEAFAAGSTWADYLASAGSHGDAWETARRAVSLTDAHRATLATFERDMRVLIVSGAWCGDCVRQGPVLAAIADACERLELRFIDRDAPASPIASLAINGGHRVPVTVFMAEDGAFVSALGDRTLSYYRWLAAQQLGPACPVPGAPIPRDVLASLVKDWMDECERVQLLLRLSPRLRALHGD